MKLNNGNKLILNLRKIDTYEYLPRFFLEHLGMVLRCPTSEIESPEKILYLQKIRANSDFFFTYSGAKISWISQRQTYYLRFVREQILKELWRLELKNYLLQLLSKI